MGRSLLIVHTGSSAPPLTFGLLPAVDLGRTGRTILSPIGAGIENRSTQAAWFAGLFTKKRRFQFSVQRQDRSSEIFADQRFGNALDTDVGIPPIVQQQAIPIVIVATLMYQPLDPAKLLIV